MTKLKTIFSATALVSVAMSTAATAQPVSSNPGRCEAAFPNANCQNVGRGNPYTNSSSGTYRRERLANRRATRTSQRGWNDSDWNGGDNGTGFWPADVAGGVVGGAIGAAGAIATAPFRAADAYAWDNSYASSGGYPGGSINSSSLGTYNSGRVAGNWVACAPVGSTVMGQDGLVHTCR
jgi:hypothetical protein